MVCVLYQFACHIYQNMASSEEVENTENKCLKYIEDSFKLLEQARAAALEDGNRSRSSTSSFSTNIPTPASAGPSSETSCSLHRTESVNKDFRESFPGLSSRSSGRQLQHYLPSSSSRGRRSSPYPRRGNSSSPSCSTWPHDFVCLSSSSRTYTPTSIQTEMLRKAGLGKKRVVFQDKFGGKDT